jgi:hypothetical protein
VIKGRNGRGFVIPPSRGARPPWFFPPTGRNTDLCATALSKAHTLSRWGLPFEESILCCVVISFILNVLVE